MLILGRRVEQDIILDLTELIKLVKNGYVVSEIIKIKIVGIEYNKVKLGFSADNTVSIMRSELLEKQDA